ncbi:MAG: DUF1097 domain-containing protein [Candidatus Niyogibacteria bacterium]|nr:DUF1097 domain-containing protein [Candidatus Niyogibacteria bacterium]
MANIQPSLNKWFPVALLVGVLAGFSVLLTIQVGALYGSWIAAPWVLFISWGGWFSIGAKTKRLSKYLAALTGGIVFGWLTLIVNGYLTAALGPVWGLPTTVFLAATCIVLLELTNLFELAFVYFLTYAGYFAYVFGGFGGDVSSLQNAVYFWILTMVGVVFALVNVYLKNKLFDIERVPLDQRNTLFDKEY